MKRHPVVMPAVVLLVVMLAVMVLAGCERDRPAPLIDTTPSADALLTAEPSGEAVDLRSDSSQTALDTPVPLEAESSTSARQPTPTAAPQAEPQVATGSQGGTVYTVQKGDTLGAIARKYGTTTKAIQTANPSITNADVLTVGQKITIPALGSSSSAASSGSSGQGEGAGTNVYVVQRGDILSSIAKRFGVSLSEVQRVNNIQDADQIIVGQKLIIPSGGQAAAPASTGQARTYVVKRGDTLSSIAVKFGVTVAQLQAANNISDPNKITLGQELRIP